MKLEFHGAQVTSDAGLLARRELDEALELADLGNELLNDCRTGKNTQHTMVAPMWQSVTNVNESFPLPEKNGGRS